MTDFQDMLLMIAATQGGGAYIPTTPGPDLITNGGFASGASWTPQGSPAPTISGGAANFTGSTNGNLQRFTQTLAGGSSPQGSYRVTLDYAFVNGSFASTGTVVELVAANGTTSRGFTSIGFEGTARTYTIVASGEVSNIRLTDNGTNDCTIDNVKLQLLS